MHLTHIISPSSICTTSKTLVWSQYWGMDWFERTHRECDLLQLTSKREWEFLVFMRVMRVIISHTLSVQLLYTNALLFKCFLTKCCASEFVRACVCMRQRQRELTILWRGQCSSCKWRMVLGSVIPLLHFTGQSPHYSSTYFILEIRLRNKATNC